jgi:hypothetical protein
MTEDLARDDEALNLEANGTQFTRFTGTNGQKLTQNRQAGLMQTAYTAAQRARRVRSLLALPVQKYKF